MPENYQIEILIGQEAAKYIDFVAQWRIKIFKEFPYLYVGDLQDEKDYMESYLDDQQFTLVVAKYGDAVVGVSTGVPLSASMDSMQQISALFSKHHLDPVNYYCLGELLILPEHRGKGLVNQLISVHHEWIKSAGFKHCTLFTVCRDENDPRKPKDYQSTENVWKRCGYERNHLKITFSWPTILPSGEVKEQENELEFWVKNL